MIDDWRPGVSFAWTRRGLGTRTTGTHVITPAAGGECSVALTITHVGPMAGLVARLTGGLTKRYMSTELAGLKERAESTRQL